MTSHAEGPGYFVHLLMMDLRRKYDEAFRQKLCECLVVLLSDFTPDKVVEIAPRITIKVFEGQKLKEVYLDATEPTAESGTYLFCFSDEADLIFSDNRVTATIG